MQGQDALKETTVKKGARGINNTLRSLHTSAKLSCDVEGVDEIIKAFAKLPEEAIFRLAKPSTECAEIVAKKAKTKMHSRSGDLAKSIIVRKPGKSKSKAYQVFARVGFSQKNMKGEGGNGYYGAQLELGHKMVLFGRKTDRRVTERPFLRPAADESKEEVAKKITDEMNKLILEYTGR